MCVLRQHLRAIGTRINKLTEWNVFQIARSSDKETFLTTPIYLARDNVVPDKEVLYTCSKFECHMDQITADGVQNCYTNSSYEISTISLQSLHNSRQNNILYFRSCCYGIFGLRHAYDPLACTTYIYFTLMWDVIVMRIPFNVFRYCLNNVDSNTVSGRNVREHVCLHVFLYNFRYILI